MRAVLVFAAVACAALSFDTVGQPYPSRPVRMVVPYTPGGLADGVARVLSQSLGKMWNQPVVIENRPGADGSIGSEIVAKSAPDGYTLLLAASGPLVINQALYSKMPFDTLRDFAPVTVVYWSPQVLIVSASLPVNSAAELIEYIKRRPGVLNFSSAGHGSPPHLAGEIFKIRADLNIVHVPYKGGPEMAAAVINGEAIYNFGGMNVLPLVRAGRIKMLAISSQRRSALAPELPTLDESGLPGVDVSVWGGILVPAKTPAEHVQKLFSDITKVLADPENKPRFTAAGIEIVGNTPEEFAAQIRAESARWSRDIKAAGIKIH